MSLYNFDFDIASLVIYLTIMVAYLPKRHVDRRQQIFFQMLYIFGLLTSVFDLVDVVLIVYAAPAFPVHVVSILYYCCRLGATYFFLLYIISIQNVNKNTIKTCVLIGIPVFVMYLFIFTTPFTGLVYSYNPENTGNVYVSGPFRKVIYIVYIFYYLLVSEYVIKYRKNFNQHLRHLLYVISLINVTLSVLQVFVPNLLVVSFAFSVSILLLVINIEKYTNVLDSVTGLAKRDYFEEICEKYFQNGKEFAVILISIPNYDKLVQNFGIKNMTLIFTQIGKCLVAHSDIGRAFKINNNNYALLRNYDEDFDAFEEKLYEELSKSWPLENMEIPVDTLLSCIKCPDNAEDMDALIRVMQAFRTENNKSGILRIDDFNVENIMYERQMAYVISEALRNNRFMVHYQPICMAESQNFVTAEALIRLTDPDLGNIPPDDFIPVAEKNGSIIEIGNYVLESVCQFIKNHDMESLGLNYIEVNLSTIQCLQPDFIENLEKITSKYEINPKYLCFEITETGTTDAPKVLYDNLEILSKKGYLLALDDFGTGFSSLKRMVSSNYGIIKFDKQLTQQFSEDNNLQKVYTKLLTVFQTMGSKVVSEGVETKEQYEFVRDAGCGYIQGFFFSKPLPENLFCDFLKTRRNIK